MCGSPDVDDTAQRQQQEEADRLRREEEARQARINAGLGDIGAIFEGGRVQTGVNTRQVAQARPVIEVIPGAEVAQRRGGNPLNNGRDDQLLDLRLTQPAQQFRLGDQVFNSRAAADAALAAMPAFTTVEDPVFAEVEGIDPFLQQRRAAQEQFFFPQLDEQREDAQEDLLNALARSGLSRSSVANERNQDLEDDFALAAAKIASDIDADIARTRSGFEQQRTAIEAGLRSSGDRGAAVQQAQRAVFNLQQDAPDFSVLPSLFEGATAGIGAAREGQRITDLNNRISQGTIPLRNSAGTVVR